MYVIRSMSMDRKWNASVVVLVLLSCSIIIIIVANAANIGVNNNEEEEDQSKISALWVWQRLRSAYSMYSSLIFPTSIGQYWHMVKTIVNHTYAYFFPPNIDFRRGDDEVQAMTGEKVKEALAKSLGTSKATLEDAAKSAADIAKEKLKRTFSHDDNKEEKKRPKEL